MRKGTTVRRAAKKGSSRPSRRHSGLELVSANQFGGADVEECVQESGSILSTLKTPDGSLAVDGIFCPNESSTFAMLRVLQDNGWAGKVRFIGFDASENLVKGLRANQIDGLIVQDPVKMGYLGVKTLVAHIHGEKVERRIDTGVRLVTPERDGQARRQGAAPARSRRNGCGSSTPPLRDAGSPQGIWRDERGRRRGFFSAPR